MTRRVIPYRLQGHEIEHDQGRPHQGEADRQASRPSPLFVPGPGPAEAGIAEPGRERGGGHQAVCPAERKADQGQAGDDRRPDVQPVANGDNHGQDQAGQGVRGDVSEPLRPEIGLGVPRVEQRDRQQRVGVGRLAARPLHPADQGRGKQSVAPDVQEHDRAYVHPGQAQCGIADRLDDWAAMLVVLLPEPRRRECLLPGDDRDIVPIFPARDRASEPPDQRQVVGEQSTQTIPTKAGACQADDRAQRPIEASCHMPGQFNAIDANLFDMRMPR